MPIVTAWAPYAPVLVGFGTPALVNFKQRQVGESLEVEGYFQAVNPTAVEGRIGFPTSLTSVSTLSTTQVAGPATRSLSGAVAYYALKEASTTYFTIGAQSVGGAGMTKVDGNGFLTTGSVASITASVEIAGWKATQTLREHLQAKGLAV